LRTFYGRGEGRKYGAKGAKGTKSAKGKYIHGSFDFALRQAQDELRTSFMDYTDNMKF